MKISRRKFLQITGLTAGASMLPLPVKYLGAGKAEAFYQTKNVVPLYGTQLRLGFIPIAFPNPLAGEFSPAEEGTGFPYTFPKSGMTQGMKFPNPTTGPIVIGPQTGAPVTGVRHFTLGANQYDDQICPSVPGMGRTTLWGYKPALTLLEGLGTLQLTTASAPVNPYYFAAGTAPQPQLHLGGIIIAEGGRPGTGYGTQMTMVNNLPLKHIIPNDLTIPGANQGPDRMAIHCHGGIMPWIADGGPFDWFCSTERAKASPPVTEQIGASFINNVVLNPNQQASKTQGEYYWETDHQSARFIWYHDHAFGITRINAYAGLATGLLVRDDFERGMVGNATGGAYTQFTSDPHPPDYYPAGLGLPPLLETSFLDGVLNVEQSLPSLGYWPVREYPLVFQDKIFISGTGTTPVRPADPAWPSTAPQSAGSLWYPHTYERARWARGSSRLVLPTQSCIAEMFADTMLVNGTASPNLDVEPRRYRFRMLNACNARFLNLQLYVADYTSSPTGINLDANGNPTNTAFVNNATGDTSWLQISAEAGFLQFPCKRPSNLPITTGTFPYVDPVNFSLLVGSAERPDVIVDFGKLNTALTAFEYANKDIILYNDCPGPFPGGDPRNDYFPGLNNGNPVNIAGLPTDLSFARNTRCIMKFHVGPTITGTGPEGSLTLTTSTDLTQRSAPSPWNLEPQLIKVSTQTNPVYSLTNLTGEYILSNWGLNNSTITTNVWNGTSVQAKTTTINKWKNMSLNEGFDAYGRLEQRLGPLSSAPNGLAYIDPLVTVDYVTNGNVELWAIYNTTADVHPMHLHMSNWQVVGRQPFQGTAPNLIPSTTVPMRGALPDETGFKETVKCWPGEIVYIIARWDIPQIDGPSTANFDPPTSLRPGLTGYNETVWHCHILEHEEHDMMRPLAISIATYAIPNVVGLSLPAATSAIGSAPGSLGVGTVRGLYGNVTSQSPVSTNLTRFGGKVNLVLTTTTVPDVVGMTFAAAKTALTNAGLIVGTVTGTINLVNTVAIQVPAAETTPVATGTSVDLTMT